MGDEKAEIRETLEWTFDNILDDDKSGFIEKREAAKVAKCLGLGFFSEHAGDAVADIDAFWQAMLKLDTDGDGKISRMEYCTYLENHSIFSREHARNLKFEMDLKNNQAKALQQMADAVVDDLDTEDMDGNVIEAVPKPAAPAPKITDAKRKALEAKFKEMDGDGNGQLAKAEIADVLLLDEDDPILVELWKVADKDGDGSITWEEFVGAADAFDKADVEASLGDLPPGM